MPTHGSSPFGGLLRQLRTRAQLSQQELAESATLSTRTVSDLERGINRTAHKATAELLADALGLAGRERASFVQAARGRPPVPAGAEIPEQQDSLVAGDASQARSAGWLLGRDGELAMLAGLVTALGAGQGSAVLIEGEPGIGKSALAEAAVVPAANAGYEIFWGTGDELGQAFPLLPLLEGLRVREPSENPRRNTIVRLMRGEDSLGRSPDVSAALTEQLLALVAEHCAQTPAILVVDDLQWADVASVTLWGRLARTVGRMPLLLVGMMRPVPRRDDLLALRRAAGVTRLRLSGLSGAAVADLVAALAGGMPDEKLLLLAEGAAGNPLYVTELVAALARSSSVTITGTGTAELTSGSAPGSLAAAIADRVGFVPGPVREVLRAAALLGVHFAVPDLAVVLGRSVTDLVSAIDDARAAGVLAESGTGLRFRHPLIRTALYGEIPAPVRTAWHRDAARMLAEADAPADRVARQLLQAVGTPGAATGPMDQWMLSWLAGGADLLVSQAPQVAAELLRQAVTSSPAGSAQHGFLAGRLADALYRVGNAAEAEQVVTRTLARATDPDLLADLHWTLAQCRMRAGKFAESLDTLNQALASPGISDRHRARLLVLAARTHSNRGDAETAGQVAAAALEVASEAGDNWAMGWALHVLTIVTGAQRQMTDALPLFERALTVTEADPALTDLQLLLQINKAVALGNLDRYEEAIGAARGALYLADGVGTAIRRFQAHSALGELLFDTGRWDEAMAEVEALPEDLKDAMAACCDLGIAAVICFHRGELATARRYLAAATPHAERIGSQVIGSLVLARSLDREHAGDPADALAALTAAFAGDTEELDEIEDLLPDAVRLAIATGDVGTAQTLAGHAADLAAGSQIPHRQASTLHCSGLLEHDAAGLLTAAERYADADRPLLAANALEAAGEEFLRTEDRSQARAAVIRAADIYTSLGALADTARLQAGAARLWY
jgi:tetratricopeptide (TPR) repeat protein/transcriptional regulator with XRE-family HTH domain